MGMDAPEKRRWFCPTPGWLVLGSLAVTGLLWLSNWLEWPAWHKGYAVLVAVAGVGVVLAVILVWWLAALVFRWRFQFGLRTLLVLTVAVALPFSWLATEINKAREQKAAVAAINNAPFPVSPARILYDYQWREDNLHLVDSEVPVAGPSIAYPLPGESPAPVWLRCWLGDDFFDTIKAINGIPADRLASVADWTGLKFLQVGGNGGGGYPRDGDLVHLEALTNLEYLDLDDAGVTDAGLRHLRNLTKLRCLRLGNTSVGDHGLALLSELPNVREIELVGTLVTIEGVERLVNLPSLETLYLPKETFDDQELRKARQLMPRAEIDAFSPEDIAVGAH